MRARILFVDDEPAVLDSLSDVLRKERKRWDMTFAANGREALELLAASAFDIVVTDMRMPGMDGAQLLAQVKAEHPSISRIVLSGHADREAVTRAISVAHQFLSKPCDGTILRSTIERVHALRLRIESDEVKAVVGRIDRLPSIPQAYHQLTAIANDPTKGLADVCRVIERDTAMSAKVLQLVSSSYFGTRRDVRSIQQAVGLLGIELLKVLVLTANTFAVAKDIRIEGASLEEFQRFSIACARAAKRMAPPALAEEAFTAALVHDLGKLILALGRLDEAEAGVGHAEVGGYLLGLWGLPFTILEAVAYHHTPSAMTEDKHELLAIVHAAGALVGKSSELDEAFLASVGVASQLPAWRAIAEDCARAEGLA